MQDVERAMLWVMIGGALDGGLEGSVVFWREGRGEQGRGWVGFGLVWFGVCGTLLYSTVGGRTGAARGGGIGKGNS